MRMGWSMSDTCCAWIWCKPVGRTHCMIQESYDCGHDTFTFRFPFSRDLRLRLSS